MRLDQASMDEARRERRALAILKEAWKYAHAIRPAERAIPDNPVDLLARAMGRPAGGGAILLSWVFGAETRALDIAIEATRKALVERGGTSRSASVATREILRHAASLIRGKTSRRDLDPQPKVGRRKARTFRAGR